MNWLSVRLCDSSSQADYDAWGQFRTFGRTSFIRGGVLMWSSAMTGAGIFFDLLFHFARSGEWRVGMIWLVFLIGSILISLAIYKRAWYSNEKYYLNYLRA